MTEADRQLDASELDGAARTIERVERRAASFIIDRRFVQRKMDRLDRAIEQARLSPAQQKELAGETQSIVHLMLEGDLITSSAEMSRLRARLAASH